MQRLLSKNMSTLAQLPKTSSLTAALKPDNAIPNRDIAWKNENNIIRKPRILHDGAFSWTLPEERKEYKYITLSTAALKDLGLSPNEVESTEYQKIVSGEVYQEEEFRGKYPFPYSQAYAGWQFGQFAGQLGDGRVHTLFEIEKPQDTKKDTPKDLWNRNKYEIQLKGSGMTPYLRFADGKAVARSSIREYIISEHLHSIGIPTTRALSLTYLPKTYARRSLAEKCAIVARFAELWLRLGTFDLYRWRFDNFGVRRLADYVNSELFTVQVEGKQVRFPYVLALLGEKPEFVEGLDLTDYDRMYLEIVIRNATTTAMWQSYGFLNGVLNTDNTSVLGLSMDFGPFSIMDKFDPSYTPNSEDHQSRYGYANTPTAIWWNLTRLGEDLSLLIGAGDLVHEPDFVQGIMRPGWEDKIVKRALKVIESAGEIYKHAFTKKYVETFFNRLGLPHSLINEPDTQNSELLEPMLEMLKKVQCDYNKFFLTLQNAEVSNPDFDRKAFAESILLKEVSEFEAYDREELTQMVDAWLRKYQVYARQGRQSSSKYNPVFLPRNWILDEVITFTQESNFEDLSYLHKLEKMSFHPFDASEWGDELKEVEKKWMLQGDMGEDYAMLQCSCSS